MSGGSYRYLFIAMDLEEVVEKRDALREMADRLAGLDEAEFPGATAAAQATLTMVHQLRLWDAHVTAQAGLLSDVWKAVEWWDSNDSGPDGVRRELAKMLDPRAP